MLSESIGCFLLSFFSMIMVTYTFPLVPVVARILMLSLQFPSKLPSTLSLWAPFCAIQWGQPVSWYTLFMKMFCAMLSSTLFCNNISDACYKCCFSIFFGYYAIYLSLNTIYNIINCRIFFIVTFIGNYLLISI